MSPILGKTVVFSIYEHARRAPVASMRMQEIVRMREAGVRYHGAMRKAFRGGSMSTIALLSDGFKMLAMSGSAEMLGNSASCR